LWNVRLANCSRKQKALVEKSQGFGEDAAKQVRVCFALYLTGVRFAFLTQRSSSDYGVKRRESRWRELLTIELVLNNQTFL